jgi:hypothetical protein
MRTANHLVLIPIIEYVLEIGRVSQIDELPEGSSDQKPECMIRVKVVIVVGNSETIIVRIVDDADDPKVG